MASMIGYHYDTGNKHTDAAFAGLHAQITEAGIQDLHHVVGFQAVEHNTIIHKVGFQAAEHNTITHKVLYEVYYIDTRGVDRIWLNCVR